MWCKFFFSFILIEIANANYEDGELILNLLNLHYDSVALVSFYTCQASKKDIASTTKLYSKHGISTLFHKDFNGFFAEYKAVENTLIVLDTSCNFTALTIERANEYKKFDVPYKWLLIHTDSEFRDLFEDIDILVDSDITIATKTSIQAGNKESIVQESKFSYELMQIYKRKINTEIITEYVGSLIEGNFELNPNYIKSTARRRQNLQNITLNNCIVVTQNDSIQHLLDKRMKHIDTITKLNYVFMLHMADILNVTMNFTVVGTWGYLGNDSQWTGMIGELTRKHADIGGTPLFFTSDRVRIIDYLVMATQTKSKFVFRQPKLSYVMNVYTLPFDSGVWIACLISMLITAIGLYFGVKWEWYKSKKYVEYKNVSNSTELRDSPIDVAFVAFAAMCQQGANAIPFSVAGRIITIVMYTSLMFLYTSYSANIVALLQSSSNSIQTLEDLLKSRLQVGVHDTVFNHFYFPKASEPIRKALYQQKVIPPGQPPRFFSIEEGIRRLRQGLFAFHMETGAGYKIVGETFLEDEKCGLQEIQFMQVPDPFLAVQKNTSYKEMITIGLRKIYECGIQHREMSLLYTKRPTCISRGSSFMGVAIVDCYPAALVFVIGIAIAFSIFILELLTYQFKYFKFIYRRIRRLHFFHSKI